MSIEGIVAQVAAATGGAAAAAPTMTAAAAATPPPAVATTPPPAAAATPAPAQAAPAAAGFTLTAEQWRDFTSAQSRIAELEAADRQRQADARDAEVKALQAKGQIEQAFTLQRQQAEQTIAAERKQREEVEERAQALRPRRRAGPRPCITAARHRRRRYLTRFSATSSSSSRKAARSPSGRKTSGPSASISVRCSSGPSMRASCGPRTAAAGRAAHRRPRRSRRPWLSRSRPVSRRAFWTWRCVRRRARSLACRHGLGRYGIRLRRQTATAQG